MGGLSPSPPKPKKPPPLVAPPKPIPLPVPPDQSGLRRAAQQTAASGVTTPGSLQRLGQQERQLLGG
jgi:hypothetical protein